MLDRVLSAEEPCLGAVFCSYTFDPTFFEEQVLHTILRLRSDPQESPAQFLQEAREGLQASPVVCMVDAEARQPGKRLPYDLYLVRARTYHPKVYLVLYASHARLAIGSGNLTKAGFGQNTEAFFVREVSYGDSAGSALLRVVARFLDRSFELTGVGQSSERSQYQDVRAALEARISGVPEPRGPSRFAIATSFDGALLAQLGEVLPKEGRIRRVGVLAPFFERDDEGAASLDDGMSGAMGELLSLRPSEGAIVDIAVPWDDAPVAPPPTNAHRLEDGVGKLWAQRIESEAGEGSTTVEYFVIRGLGPKRVEVETGDGLLRRLERDRLEREVKERRLWPVLSVRAHAPRTIVSRIAEQRELRLWLHPTTSLTDRGRPQRRGLHAKAVFVTTEHRGRTSTTALIGSANASRAALQRSVSEAGNVELCVICRFEGEVTVHDYLPSLVRASLDDVRLEERAILSRHVDLSAWIVDAVHDPRKETLTVYWSDRGPDGLGEWVLRYGEKAIAEGEGPSHAPTMVPGFVLAAGNAEIVFAAAGREWSIPIRVSDMAALPSSPGVPPLGLRELLALLGRRIGSERLRELTIERGPEGVGTLLDAVFGDGFGATDVFRAWWGIAEDLRLAATVPAFRQRLEGPTGARAVWALLRDDTEQLSSDEKWVYGCELLRELRRVDLGANADATTKGELLAALQADLLRDLDALVQGSAELPPWLPQVMRFYEVGGRP